MGSKDVKTTDAVEVAGDELPLSLQEFCTRLSVKDSRVELISGFEMNERLAGRLKDTDSAYNGRYQEFINQPA